MKSTLDEWSTYDDDNFWQILSRSGHSSSHRNYLSRKLAPKKMGSKLFWNRIWRDISFETFFLYLIMKNSKNISWNRLCMWIQMRLQKMFLIHSDTTMIESASLYIKKPSSSCLMSPPTNWVRVDAQWGQSFFEVVLKCLCFCHLTRVLYWICKSWKNWFTYKYS